MGPRFVRFAALLLSVAVVGAGCGPKESRKPVFPVKGGVFVGGKPAERAQVIFHPVGDADPKAPRATGEVAADGSFTLSTYTAGDGAPAGEYAVTVIWAEGTSAIGGDADAGPDRLVGRYSNPRTTPLKARVNEAATDLSPFKLTK